MKLEEWLPQSFDLLEELDEQDELAIKSRDLVLPADEFSVEKFVALRSHKDYNNYRVEVIVCYTDKATIRRIGLLILAAAFRGGQEVRLNLNNAHSHIGTFSIEIHSAERLDKSTATLHLNELKYWPAQPNRYPWKTDEISGYDLPIFQLTNENDFSVNSAEREARDLVRCPGSMVGALRFAELLLNISLASCQQDEFDLECEVGFRGVGPGSSELKIWLPGSLGWEDFN